MLYLTLRQYEYIAAVASAGSLSGAASQLNVSQPSLSVALTQVEKRLGQRLFLRRKGAPITLTEAGKAYVGKVEDLLALARGLDDPKLIRQSVSGRVTLGFFEDLAPFHIGPLLQALSRDLPQAEIRYHVAGFTSLARDMLEGRMDLCVTYDLGLDASFAKDVLAKISPCALVARNHPIATRPEITLRDLAGHPLILSEDGLSVRHVLGLFQKIDARPTVRHRVRSLELMRSLVGSGAGVGISYTVPPSGQAYDGKRIKAVPIADDFAKEPIILARNGLAPMTDMLRQSADIIVRSFSLRPIRP
jgi:DNA-binding transcriptional LysR family regulator